MRVLRATRASLVGLAAGYLVAFIGALLLRTVGSDASLITKLVSPLRIASWTLGLAHAAPVVVHSAAGVDAARSGSLQRLAELLGGHSDVIFTFSIVLVPLTILALTGIVVAFGVLRLNPKTTRELFGMAGVASVTHGIALALLARISSLEFAFTGRVASQFGLGVAKGYVLIGAGQRPLVAGLLGAGWGAAFALAGGMSSEALRPTLELPSRIVLLGWLRGLTVVSFVLAGVMALGAFAALITGHAPGIGAILLGGLMLGANAIAAGIVMAHGVSLSIALDAGPFTGWQRMDLLHVGASGKLNIAMLFGAFVPILAGVVAGRFIRRRSDLQPVAIAWRFGALWGLTLAAFSMLLRVRVLSSLSVGELNLGGGSAAFDPLIALGLGVAWGTATSFVGARFTRVTPSTVGSRWVCDTCNMANAERDGFCVSCGAKRPVFA